MGSSASGVDSGSGTASGVDSSGSVLSAGSTTLRGLPLFLGSGSDISFFI